MTEFKTDMEFATSDAVKRKNYQIVIKNFPVKKFDAIEQEPGKDPNDFNCELTDGTNLRIEFKNRRPGAIWNDMALEIYQDIDLKTPGCIFKLADSEVDYVIYTWHGKEKECYIILKAKDLGLWWKDNYKNYEMRINKPSSYDGRSWQSSWTPVPIKDFPKDIIHRHETFIDLNDFWGKK